MFLKVSQQLKYICVNIFSKIKHCRGNATDTTEFLRTRPPSSGFLHPFSLCNKCALLYTDLFVYIGIVQYVSWLWGRACNNWVNIEQCLLFSFTDDVDPLFIFVDLNNPNCIIIYKNNTIFCCPKVCLSAFTAVFVIFFIRISTFPFFFFYSSTAISVAEILVVSSSDVFLMRDNVF